LEQKPLNSCVQSSKYADTETADCFEYVMPKPACAKFEASRKMLAELQIGTEVEGMANLKWKR
jgi:hypothetical protein